MGAKIHVLEYLEERAAERPQDIAIEDENRQVTFGEFVAEAKAKGTDLAERLGGVKKSPVFVETGRTVESVLAYFAVLYSGNFYVAVDEDSPSFRMKEMAEEFQPVAAIAVRENSDLFRGFCPCYFFGKMGSDSDASLAPWKELLDTDPCYMVLTSGSTGVPKGVVISHRMILDLGFWLKDTFGFTKDDILANQSPFTFDGAAKDLYLMVFAGVKVVIMPKELFMSPLRLVEFLNEKEITAILWAASAVSLVSSSGVFSKIRPTTVKKVFFSGEALPAKQLNLWRKALPAKYVNLYGPSECTVDAMYYEVNREFSEEESIPLGVSCRNMEVFLLDEDDREVTEGIGEICIRGSAVALGYYRNPKKTQEVFVQNPLHNNYRDIVYKTGDLARRTKDGEMVFVSRKDFQIKHMGYRIELGEIEQAFQGMEGINHGIAFYDEKKSQIVYAYTGREKTKKEFFLYGKDRLPKYMIPRIWIHWGKFPVTPNGKIDRKRIEDEYVRKNSDH